MQTIKQHYEKIKKGICPLCGSKKGFETQTLGKNTEYESITTYCKKCKLEIA